VPSQTTLPAHVGEPLAPALLGPHVPFSVPLCFSVAAHASHAPAQAVSQQYPSAQLPLVHCVPAVHEAPCDSFATHWLDPLHQYPDWQSVSPLQLVPHCPDAVTHLYAVHVVPVAAT
jgi:hypothetical protein